jgi:hypothetical protein
LFSVFIVVFYPIYFEHSHKSTMAKSIQWLACMKTKWNVIYSSSEIDETMYIHKLMEHCFDKTKQIWLQKKARKHEGYFT